MAVSERPGTLYTGSLLFVPLNSFIRAGILCMWTFSKEALIQSAQLGKASLRDGHTFQHSQSVEDPVVRYAGSSAFKAPPPSPVGPENPNRLKCLTSAPVVIMLERWDFPHSIGFSGGLMGLGW
jgi:hypothetical protein